MERLGTMRIEMFGEREEQSNNIVRYCTFPLWFTTDEVSVRTAARNEAVQSWQASDSLDQVPGESGRPLRARSVSVLVGQRGVPSSYTLAGSLRAHHTCIKLSGP